MRGDSQPQNQPQSEPQAVRRASEGDVQTGMSGSQEDIQREQGMQDLSHSASQPALAPRPGISPASSSMVRASSNQETATPTARSEAESRPNPQISFPASVLPQSAGSDRPSSDPSLVPLVYPTVTQSSPDSRAYPSLGENFPGFMGSRPQSRTTAASITPPNIYDFLPHNLYASLHIHSQDPRHSLSSNGSNGIHSPVSPSLSRATAASHHQPYGVWVPSMNDHLGAMSPAPQYGYGVPPEFQRTSSRERLDSQGSSFSSGENGHPSNAGQHSQFDPTPDTNMAYMSMHQALEPQHRNGMGNGFPYQPIYQYHDVRQGAFSQPAWMPMTANGYPYSNHQFAGKPQYGQYGYQDQRGRGRGRGARGRGRGGGFRAGNQYPGVFPGQNMPYFSAQNSGSQSDHAQWQIAGDTAPPSGPSGRQADSSHPTSPGTFNPAAPAGPSLLQAASSESALKAAESGRETALDGETAARVLVRKPYHPAPPANRSEWVMWVGNV